MSAEGTRWFEVWFSEGEDILPTYMLVVTPDPETPSSVMIVDPLEKNRVIFRGRSYEEATDWLREDE